MKKITYLFTFLALCSFTLGFSQADCTNALALTPGSPQAGDTTGQSGSFSDSNTPPEVNPCSSNYNDLEYWFSYTAAVTGETLDISVTDLTTNYYGVFVIDNCPDSSPNCIASDTNGFSSADLSVTTPTLTAGTTYYVVVTDWIEGPTTFTMNSTVNAPPTCPDPSGLTIDSFTATSVQVSWTPGGTETAWEIVVQADNTGTPGTGDGAGTDTGSNPYTDNSLSSDTAYEVYLRAECTSGSDFSDWIGPVDFTTPCSTIVPEYNANMSNHVPDSCWDEAGAGDPGAGPSSIGFSDWRGGTSYAFGDSNAINIFGTSKREWLLSPTFDLSADDYQLEVNVAVTDWQSTTADDDMGADDEVQLLISTDGGSTWTNLTTWNVGNEPLPGGTDYVADLTAYTGTAQFAIWASSGTTSGQDYDFHVGKFRVVEIPSSATVDFCNLQFPNSGSINEGDNFTAFAQVFVTGVTEPAGQGADIEAWIGYSTTDATTTADFETPSWTWVPATYNTDSSNNDEYQAEIGSSLAGGSYFYASRFRYDGGVFAYGGIIPGSSGGNFWDGSSYISGQLTVLPTAPTTSATFNIAGCDDSDTFSTAYDGNVQNVYWIELIYDGNCSEISTDTETSTGIDTEIGIYDIFGNLIESDDDGGTGTLSSITRQGLAAGTYYVAAGGFNTVFGANFAVTSGNTSTGTLVINASTPNFPDFVSLQFPGTATITAGNTATVFAQIFEAGNTPGAGAGTNITAEIGISSVDATTTADFETVNWTWTAAPYFGESGNNDEYSLDIGASLAPGTYYYVSRFSVDGGPFVYGGNTAGPGEGGNFWDGTGFVSGVLTVNPAGEPTNHVTGFTAGPDSDTQITLAWSDNDGAQAADGFLIVGKTGAASFYIPVDGTDDADDTDWSDDEFEVKVGSGVETYVVTGLTADTAYDFEIYPYTNTGALIDYKTDPVVPNASATTDPDPCLVAVTSYPFTEGFESGVPPQCWVSFRGTNGEGTVHDWTTSGTANSGSSSAFVRYESVATSAQDWLVTPLLDFSSLTNPQLSFFARESFGSDFGSVHSIQVSTTDTNIASFTSVQGYTEADFSSSTFEEFIVDLTAYAGQSTVYVAFVMENNDGDSWFIDDVTIENNPPVTYTFNGSWSPSDPNGASDANDDIVISSGDAVISADTNANSVTVNPGASITVNTGFTLTLSDAVNGLTLESSSTSYSSLILDGTIAGTLNYERHVNINGSGSTGNNDLISAPFTGQQFDNFVAANSNILNSAGTYLFGPFDKTSGAYVNWLGTNTTALTPGVGYRAASSDNSTFTFTGVANTGTVLVGITNSGPSFAEWNLLGNPLPSYLNIQDFLNNTANAALLDENNVGIYGYDGAASDGWTILNLATTTATDIMAPGQGFFVAAESAGDIEFTQSMRRTGSSDDFITGRNAALTYFKVQINTNSQQFDTGFYFNDNSTLGLDPGYDAAVWGDTAPTFSIYSNLVEENNGKEMAIQSLNSVDISDVTIPLGVNASAGEQLTFTISETTIPSTAEVYLDDAQENTTTLLSSSDYVITPTTDLSGTGRFYLRVVEQSLSTDDNSFDGLKIYTKSSPRALFVHGNLSAETTAQVFDLQGRLVHRSILNTNSLINEIDASDFSDGVYIVTLNNGVQEKSQKVVIR